mmetsp:Transcript_102924/g.286686  ORF Transcript_102924/g.286686 Transcript_102924/m.286686 type:complete len:85 (-) Transcript_102924:625-879(-)
METNYRDWLNYFRASIQQLSYLQPKEMGEWFPADNLEETGEKYPGHRHPGIDSFLVLQGCVYLVEVPVGSYATHTSQTDTGDTV